MGRACLLPLSRRGRAGASWPIFGPTRACLGLLLEASLSLDLPAQRATFHLPGGVGLPSFLWPSTLGLKGRLFLPAQPVLSSSLDALGPEPPTPACPSALPPAPGVTAPSFCSLSRKSRREEGLVFPNGPGVYTFLACWVETDRLWFFSALYPPTHRDLRYGACNSLQNPER